MTKECTEVTRFKAIEDRQNRFDDKFNKLIDKIDKINENTTGLLDLKEENKLNSNFRLKASGAMALIAFSAATFGAGVVFIITKILCKFSGN